MSPSRSDVSERMVSPQEVGEFLGISEQAVRRLRNGPRKHYIAGKVRYFWDDVLGYVAANAQVTTP